LVSMLWALAEEPSLISRLSTSWRPAAARRVCLVEN
jgi:hypothetical protein